MVGVLRHSRRVAAGFSRVCGCSPGLRVPGLDFGPLAGAGGGCGGRVWLALRAALVWAAAQSAISGQLRAVPPQTGRESPRSHSSARTADQSWSGLHRPLPRHQRAVGALAGGRPSPQTVSPVRSSSPWSQPATWTEVTVERGPQHWGSPRPKVAFCSRWATSPSQRCQAHASSVSAGRGGVQPPAAVASALTSHRVGSRRSRRPRRSTPLTTRRKTGRVAAPLSRYGPSTR